MTSACNELRDLIQRKREMGIDVTQRVPAAKERQREGGEHGRAKQHASGLATIEAKPTTLGKAAEQAAAMLITSKYASRCVVCGARLEAGEQVWWTRGAGVRCVGCGGEK
jgi:hypothetical protein